MRCEAKRCKCENTRPKVAMLMSGMDCSVVPMKRGNTRGGRGAGHPLRVGGQLKRSSVKYGEAYTGTKSKDGYSQGGPAATRVISSEDELPSAGSRAAARGDTSRMTGDRLVRMCVQERWTRSAGTKPAEARIRSLVAWIARWRETKTLKPIDDTIGRMVANHQAVAQANAYVASKVSMSGGRARNREGEGSMGHRNLIDAMNHSGGVEATAW